MPRIRYSDAVCDQVVRLVLESQKPITQVAKKFGCSVSTLQNWLKDHRQEALLTIDFFRNTRAVRVL